MSELQGHYYSENGRQYMVLGTDEEEQEDGYEMKMLEKNQPQPFLRMQIYRMNGAVTFQYDITGKKNLEEQGIKRGIKSEEVCGLIKALGKMKAAVEEYLLNLDSVLLQEKYIFLEGENIYFSYYPQKEGTFFQNMKHLWEFVLARLDHGDKEGVLMAYGFYQDLLEEVFCPEKYYGTQASAQAIMPEEQELYTSEDIVEETVSAEEEVENVRLRKGLQAISGGGKIITGIALAMAFIEDLNFLHMQFGVLIAVAGLAAVLAAGTEWCLKNPMIFLSRLEEKTKSIKFSITKKELKNLQAEEQKNSKEGKVSAQTKVMDSTGMDEILQETAGERVRTDEETQLLSLDCAHDKRRLEPVAGQGEILWISRFPAIAGSASNCNLVIRRAGISRVHLILTMEGEQVYVEDMNSTNGTWLNGCRIELGQRRAIYEGDRIRLGDVEYEYKV